MMDGEIPQIAKDTSTRFHPELDLGRLRAVYESFPDHSASFLATQTEESQAELMQSFADYVAAIDQVITRETALVPNAVSCDIINFSLGESEDRAMTKLGGVPYWPADRPWPKSWRGRPLSFLGQINFRDSLDIVGELPGEILVMFVNRYDSVTSYWLDPLDEALIARENIPDGQRIFGPQYGVIHRTYDVPGKTLAEEAEVSPGVESSIFDLKIGGLPWGHASSERGRARFLFQLESPSEIVEFDDGSVEFTLAGMTCTEWHWPFTKRADNEEPTFEMNWWAAYLRQNGKLRWSWA